MLTEQQLKEMEGRLPKVAIGSPCPDGLPDCLVFHCTYEPNPDTDEYKLIQEVRRLRAVLKWYSEKSNYVAYHGKVNIIKKAIELDHGDKAREALDEE